MTARPGFTIPFAFCCFLSLAAAPSPAKKVKRHDVIIMKNGDRLTGEVKNWKAASSSLKPAISPAP